MPITATIIAGENIAGPLVCYKSTVDGKAYISDATDPAKPAQFIIPVTKSAGDTCTAYYTGQVTYGFLSNGANYYLDPDSPGGIITTAPADNPQLVGTAISGFTLHVKLTPATYDLVRFSTTAAETLDAFDFVYCNGAGKMVRAISKGAQAYPAQAVANNSAEQDAPVTSTISGIIVGPLGLTPGDKIYLSDTVTGGFTSTPNTTDAVFVQQVGVAVSETQILINIQQPIYL